MPTIYRRNGAPQRGRLFAKNNTTEIETALGGAQDDATRPPPSPLVADWMARFGWTREVAEAWDDAV